MDVGNGRRTDERAMWRKSISTWIAGGVRSPAVIPAHVSHARQEEMAGHAEREVCAMLLVRRPPFRRSGKLMPYGNTRGALDGT